MQLLVDEEDGRQFLSGFDDPGCPEGVPIELALLSILSAFGVAFGVILTILIWFWRDFWDIQIKSI